ncbi:LysE family translocator [Aliamphritea spongicola]|uniref:LysE family translocator n=1 Tax=Aliamphritea spongicola TaxID=707589 RepID=UPI00196A23E0|nr:LysE family transporter [Aliamphritea spongicola]MBN3562267.1 LysE family transporter [Aliamphritea spongicola]
MELMVSLMLIAGALLLGAMSPGPSFIVVARAAVSRSRRTALATAVGVGVGGLIFAVLALLGLQAVLQSVPQLYLLLKVLGGGYLLYLGWNICRGAARPLQVQTGTANQDRSSWLKAFATGLLTQLSNPKTALVFSSIFAALLPAEQPGWFSALLLVVVGTLEIGWYCLMALVLSAPVSQQGYLRGKRYFDRIAAAMMGALGVRLLTHSGS